jgi:hypothetical protein
MAATDFTSPQQVADAVEKILVNSNDLKLGAACFLVFVILVGLSVVWMWFKSRRDARNADLARAELEQRGKAQRAAMIMGSNESIAKAIDGLRVSMLAHDTKLEDLIRDHESAYESRDIERERTLTSTLNSLHDVLKELLNRQKGVTNMADSIRVIEGSFDKVVKPGLFAIAEDSIRTNHWAEKGVYIQERVIADINKVFFSAEKEIEEYTLAFSPKRFFPGDPSGASDFTAPIWAIIKTFLVDASKAGAPSAEATEARVRAARIRIENLINTAVNETKKRVTGDYEPTTATLRRVAVAALPPSASQGPQIP